MLTDVNVELGEIPTAAPIDGVAAVAGPRVVIDLDGTVVTPATLRIEARSALPGLLDTV